MREGLVAGEAPIRDRQLAPAADAELLPKDVAVRLHRPGGDAKPSPKPHRWSSRQPMRTITSRCLGVIDGTLDR